jgi:hypothetical protein
MFGSGFSFSAFPQAATAIEAHSIALRSFFIGRNFQG